MREQINEEVLCVLRMSEQTNKIILEYVKIEKPLSTLINDFTLLCNNPATTLDQLINYIKANEALNQLNGKYRYCASLKGTYQAFSANNLDTIKEISDEQQFMLLNKKIDPANYNIEKAVSDYKKQLSKRYELWHNAFSINIAYRQCQDDKSILTYSHRMDGWSNPVYRLTSNFSVEIKTNFGYGHASYFYAKLKYKNIDITPFSEWIQYEHAQFSEIVRYTQSYLLANENWLNAMEFSKDACNLSLLNEEAFVEIYIIEECEKMAKGLEEIFDKVHFSFKNRDNTDYFKEKDGHTLVEFRGEKISGALDFITKILEYEQIASIQSFIKRIEVCNKIIQPILVDESKIINTKITNLNEEISKVKPIFELVTIENTKFENKKKELKNEMIKNDKLDVRQIDFAKLDTEFNSKYPEYNAFKENYKIVTESYRMLNKQVQNLINVFENINSYTAKIIKYFGQ